MKKISLLIIAILTLLFCSCGLFGDQEYDCNIEEVDSIQIVRLDKYVEGEYRYEYTVLAEISDLETFVSRLNEIEHSVNWGDPRTLKTQYVVVKIVFHNGDYDLVHQDAQWLNRSGHHSYGYFFFDDEQFEALISDYVTE